jgi:hypothetical protein
MVLEIAVIILAKDAILNLKCNKMPVPDYQSVMLPLLRQVADKKTYLFKDIVESLAKEFKLSEDDSINNR